MIIQKNDQLFTHYKILKIPAFMQSHKETWEFYHCWQFVLPDDSCDKLDYKQYLSCLSVIILLFPEINTLKFIFGKERRILKITLFIEQSIFFQTIGVLRDIYICIDLYINIYIHTYPHMCIYIRVCVYISGTPVAVALNLQRMEFFLWHGLFVFLSKW